MALNIKNREVEQIATQIALKTGETKTEVIRQALIGHRDRLGMKTPEQRVNDLMAFLDEIHQGRTFAPVTKEEWDALNDD